MGKTKLRMTIMKTLCQEHNQYKENIVNLVT